MSDSTDRGRSEFLIEAEEIVEGLGRDLVLLDEALRTGAPDPDLVNDIFRGVHTLKGLAGIFGAARLGALSTELEVKLDALRLGKLPLTADVLHLLFRSVDVYHRLLISETEGGAKSQAELDALLGDLRGAAEKAAQETGASELDLDPEIFAILTEYEEHRLRVSVGAGLRVFRLRVRFSLMTIDGSLDQLKATAKPYGEIITYLPTGEGADADSIELDILMASKRTQDELSEVLSATGAAVSEIPRVSSGGPPSRIAGPSEGVPPFSSAVIPPVPGSVVFSTIEEMMADSDKAESVSLTGPGAAFDDPDRGPATMYGAGTPAELAQATVGVNLARKGERSQTSRPARHPSSPVSSPPDRDGRAIRSEPPEPRGPVGTVRSVTQTVRVDIHKLDHLMNSVSSLAIVKSSLDRLFERMRPATTDRASLAELMRLSRTFDRQLEAMQQGILEVRMVPLGQLFERLSRVARQVSRDVDKQMNLVITGAETEIDKLIVEELSDPLMHMMRNAIDHGIESSLVRRTAGKPEVGTIALNAFQKGNHVVIELEDDGAGIDTERVIETALKSGVLNPADVRSTSRRDILNLIFLPGLSTRSQLSDISGRGVGMDVVKTNIGKLGGVIDVQSELGIGSKFTVTLPITLAIIRVLLVEVQDQVFAVPLANVREAVLVTDGDVFTVDGHEAMTLRGQSLRLCRLSHVFEIEQGEVDEPPASAPFRGRRFVVVTSTGTAKLGLVVDRIIGGQDVVMKGLGPSLRGVRGFAGAAELGDERLGLVIDTPNLLEELVLADRRRGTELAAI